MNKAVNSRPQISMVSFSHSRTSCNKTEFGMDYVPFLCSKLTKPLIDEVRWSTHCCVISGSPLWKVMDSLAICMSCISILTQEYRVGESGINNAFCMILSLHLPPLFPSPSPLLRCFSLLLPSLLPPLLSPSLGK